MVDGSLCRRGSIGLMLLALAVGMMPAAFGAGRETEALSGYRAAWSSPPVADRIREGIEKYRKGDAVLVVKGPDGAAVSNAGIEVRQITHEFLFGCNCFFLGHLKTEAKNREYELFLHEEMKQ
jgi:endo-1,4-beta-xylanase